MTMTKSSSINQPHHNCHRCHQYISPSPWANSPLINHPWRYCCLIIIFAKVNFTNQFYNNAWTLNIEHWPITYWQSTAQPVFSKPEQKSLNCYGLGLIFFSFLSILRKTRELWWKQWHNSWCSSYLQGPSPRQIPTWTLSSAPLEGSFALLGSLGDSGSSSGFFRWDCFAARLCLAPFENLKI